MPARELQSSGKLHIHLETIKLTLLFTFWRNIGTRMLSCVAYDSVSPRVTLKPIRNRLKLILFAWGKILQVQLQNIKLSEAYSMQTHTRKYYECWTWGAFANLGNVTEVRRTFASNSDILRKCFCKLSFWQALTIHVSPFWSCLCNR
jgi:hypothetical protein